MTSDININYELEKIKMGGIIYEYSNNFPTIVIHKENMEEYLNYFESINKISSVAGSDLMLLFAEFCTLIDKKTQESMQEYFLTSIGVVGYALNQSSEIISKIKSLHEEEIILGSQYCFIIIFLSELFSYYCGFINHIKMIKYTTHGIIVKSGNLENDISVGRMQGIIAFILSQEFEFLRENFKVIECYKMAHSHKMIH